MTNETHTEQSTSRPVGSVVTTVLLATTMAAALGGWWYQSTQVTSVRHQLAETQQKMDQLHGQMDTSVAMAKADVNDTVAKLNDQLEKSRREAQASTARVQANAKKQTGLIMTELSAKNEALLSQLDQVKKDNAAKSTEVDQTITGIKDDVGGVKTEVANTKTELDKTIADLKRVNGDMGVMSGLIATNGNELAALRKLGERDYIEFTLDKNGKAQKIGDIQLALKKADLKRNRFTLDVLADDKRVEKKDKGINEPVQFYTSAARIPYEVVINQIHKDKVTGYLAVPKVKLIAQR